MSVRNVVHILALVLVAPLAAGPAEAGSRGASASTVAPNGALATYSQILPPDGPPRVAPWQAFEGGVFSADGRSVAYGHTVIRQEDDLVTLRVQEAGEDPRIVWEVDRWLQLPSWSPDGERIAIATKNFGREARNSDVWLIDPAGAEEPEEILTGEGNELGVVAWSPDGSTIAYTRYGYDLFLYDVATGTSSQLTDFCTWEADGAPPGPLPNCGNQLETAWDAVNWSPDGDQLVASVNRQVVIVDPQTGEITDSIASGQFYRQAVWSPDGSSIAYSWSPVRGSGLFTAVVPVAGGQSRVVADSLLTSWQPCPAGPCATFGTPRTRSKVSVSVSRTRRAVKVRGEVGPTTDPEGSGRETVRITLQVKRTGKWRKIDVKEPRIDWERLTFAASLKRPDGIKCRVQVGYEGGWTRGPSSDTVPFRC